MNTIYQSLSRAITPCTCYLTQSKRWEELRGSPGSTTLLKIIAVATLLLGIVGIIVLKVYATSRQITSIQTQEVKSYNEALWKTLSKRVEVTPFDLRSFQGYQYEFGDQTTSEEHAENVKFFYGNCDSYLVDQGCKDIGWGCAWRSIQTCLSPFSLFYTFNSLCLKYGRKNYKDKKPSDDPTEWAEPGYGKRICRDQGIRSELYLYKRIGAGKTPTELCETIDSFSDLTQKLFDHFRNFKTPVMVDDEEVACCILGIKRTQKGHVILWIADPHKNSVKDGLYCLVLNGGTGEKLYSTGWDTGENGLSTSQFIYPDRKGWMLLFPQKINQNT